LSTIGKAIDFSTTLKVPKPTLKTRAFQEECVSFVVEQLVEHLTLWSSSVAFPVVRLRQLAFIPVVRLRQFKKETKVDRFRQQIEHTGRY
jgi:nucleolar complex protein 2